jgi:two-component sensor histidine kinase
LEQHSLRSKLQQIQTQCELLQQDVTVTLREKQILLKEVHHRVKNNLQLISSLLSLQTQYIENQTFMEILKNGQNRVKSLAIIQEQLYQFQNLAYIDFGIYVQKLIVYLSGCYLIEASEIDIDVQVDLPPLNLDLAVPCGLILNELLTNALKHAFPAGKPAQDDENCRIAIRVHHSPEQRQIVLSVADNGVGLPTSIGQQTYEKFGFKLVQLLTQQLEGTVAICSQSSTEITIVFTES